jgi:hypothetical protein
MMLKNRLKIGLKIDQKVTVFLKLYLRHGRVENDQKSSILDLGTPDPPKHKFFEIPHFFAKTSRNRTPKSTPINDPYKKLIPHKNACTFAPMGVEKCHFLGVGGADRSDRKM